MKFIVKTLLYINLLIQMASSLRNCFNQDQNIMLTVILLASSVIGIIGLTIGNRAILVIFAACTTLILIASITIYAINQIEEDPMKPRIPYYTTTTVNLDNQVLSAIPSSEQKRPRVVGSTNKTRYGNQRRKLQINPTTTTTSPTTIVLGKFEISDVLIPTEHALNAAIIHRQEGAALAPTAAKLVSSKSYLPAGNIFPASASTDDKTSYSSRIGEVLAKSDRKQNIRDMSQLGKQTKLSQITNKSSNILTNDKLTPLDQLTSNGMSQADLDANLDLQDSPNRVPNEMWIAYERHLYEKYLAILSRSIDLVLQTIMASWMALLLDDESDQCFGSGKMGSNRLADSSQPSTSQHRSNKHNTRHNKHPHQQQTVYNYNGVRYSIKPDTAFESTVTMVHS